MATMCRQCQALFQLMLIFLMFIMSLTLDDGSRKSSSQDHHHHQHHSFAYSQEILATTSINSHPTPLSVSTTSPTPSADLMSIWLKSGHHIDQTVKPKVIDSLDASILTRFLQNSPRLTTTQTTTHRSTLVIPPTTTTERTLDATTTTIVANDISTSQQQLQQQQQPTTTTTIESRRVLKSALATSAPQQPLRDTNQFVAADLDHHEIQNQQSQSQSQQQQVINQFKQKRYHATNRAAASGSSTGKIKHPNDGTTAGSTKNQGTAATSSTNNAADGGSQANAAQAANGQAGWSSHVGTSSKRMANDNSKGNNSKLFATSDGGGSSNNNNWQQQQSAVISSPASSVSSSASSSSSSSTSATNTDTSNNNNNNDTTTAATTPKTISTTTSDPMEPCYLANNRASESLTISESTPVGTVVGEITVNGDSSSQGNIELSIMMPTITSIRSLETSMKKQQQKQKQINSPSNAVNKGEEKRTSPSLAEGESMSRYNAEEDNNNLRLLDMIPPLSLEPITKQLILAKKLDRENLDHLSEDRLLWHSTHQSASLTAYVKCQLRQHQPPVATVNNLNHSNANDSSPIHSVHQNRPQARLRVNASPSAPSILIPIHIIVTDENDNWPIFLNTPYIIDMNETVSAGSILPNNEIFAVDHDQQGPLSTIEYSLVEGCSWSSSFTFLNPLDARSLILSDSSHIDYETQSKLVLKIMAKDQGDPANWAITSLVINLSDEDDLSPYFSEDKYYAQVVNNRPNEVIEVEPRRLLARDGDKSIQAPISYSFHLKTNQSIHFDLDQDSGKLTLRKTLPVSIMQESTAFCLLVKATQIDNPDRSTLTVVNVLTRGSAASKTNSGAPSGVVVTSEGQKSLHHSTIGIYTVNPSTVMQTPQPQSSSTSTVTPPPSNSISKIFRFERSNYTIEVPESLKIGPGPIFNLRAKFYPANMFINDYGNEFISTTTTKVSGGQSDHDPNVSYQLLDNDYGFFRLDEQNGRLYLNRSLDYEFINILSVRILAIYTHSNYHSVTTTSPSGASYGDASHLEGEGIGSSPNNIQYPKINCDITRVNVKILDVNDNSPEFSHDKYHFQISISDLISVFDNTKDKAPAVIISKQGNREETFASNPMAASEQTISITKSAIYNSNKDKYSTEPRIMIVQMDGEYFMEVGQIYCNDRDLNDRITFNMTGPRVHLFKLMNTSGKLYLRLDTRSQPNLSTLLAEFAQLNYIKLKVTATDDGQSPAPRSSAALIIIKIISIDNFVLHKTYSSSGEFVQEDSLVEMMTGDSTINQASKISPFLMPSSNGKSFTPISNDLISSLMVVSSAGNRHHLNRTTDSVPLVNSKLQRPSERQGGRDDDQGILTSINGNGTSNSVVNGQKRYHQPGLLLVDEAGAKFVTMTSSAIEALNRHNSLINNHNSSSSGHHPPKFTTNGVRPGQESGSSFTGTHLGDIFYQLTASTTSLNEPEKSRLMFLVNLSTAIMLHLLAFIIIITLAMRVNAIRKGGGRLVSSIGQTLRFCYRPQSNGPNNRRSTTTSSSNSSSSRSKGSSFPTEPGLRSAYGHNASLGTTNYGYSSEDSSNGSIGVGETSAFASKSSATTASNRSQRSHHNRQQERCGNPSVKGSTRGRVCGVVVSAMCNVSTNVATNVNQSSYSTSVKSSISPKKTSPRSICKGTEDNLYNHHDVLNKSGTFFAKIPLTMSNLFSGLWHKDGKLSSRGGGKQLNGCGSTRVINVRSLDDEMMAFRSMGSSSADPFSDADRRVEIMVEHDEEHLGNDSRRLGEFSNDSNNSPLARYSKIEPQSPTINLRMGHNHTPNSTSTFLGAASTSNQTQNSPNYSSTIKILSPSIDGRTQQFSQQQKQIQKDLQVAGSTSFCSQSKPSIIVIDETKQQQTSANTLINSDHQKAEISCGHDQFASIDSPTSNPSVSSSSLSERITAAIERAEMDHGTTSDVSSLDSTSIQHPSTPSSNDKLIKIQNSSGKNNISTKLTKPPPPPPPPPPPFVLSVSAVKQQPQVTPKSNHLSATCNVTIPEDDSSTLSKRSRRPKHPTHLRLQNPHQSFVSHHVSDHSNKNNEELPENKRVSPIVALNNVQSLASSFNNDIKQGKIVRPTTTQVYSAQFVVNDGSNIDSAFVINNSKAPPPKNISPTTSVDRGYESMQSNSSMVTAALANKTSLLDRLNGSSIAMSKRVLSQCPTSNPSSRGKESWPASMKMRDDSLSHDLMQRSLNRLAKHQYIDLNQTDLTASSGGSSIEQKLHNKVPSWGHLDYQEASNCVNCFENDIEPQVEVFRSGGSNSLRNSRRACKIAEQSSYHGQHGYTDIVENSQKSRVKGRASSSSLNRNHQSSRGQNRMVKRSSKSSNSLNGNTNKYDNTDEFIRREQRKSIEGRDMGIEEQDNDDFFYYYDLDATNDQYYQLQINSDYTTDPMPDMDQSHNGTTTKHRRSKRSSSSQDRHYYHQENIDQIQKSARRLVEPNTFDEGPCPPSNGKRSSYKSTNTHLEYDGNGSSLQIADDYDLGIINEDYESIYTGHQHIKNHDHHAVSGNANSVHTSKKTLTWFDQVEIT